jgi:hypothetical protein
MHGGTPLHAGSNDRYGLHHQETQLLDTHGRAYFPANHPLKRTQNSEPTRHFFLNFTLQIIY